MSVETYLAALDAKLRELEELVAAASIQRELDANLGRGFIKGHITFVNGSTLGFGAASQRAGYVSLSQAHPARDAITSGDYSD